MDRPHDYEHLMIIFFDVLAFANFPLLNYSHKLRREALSNLVKCIPGRAELAEHDIIDFSKANAADFLRRSLTKCITLDGEGLIVRPADEPYFNFVSRDEYKSCCVKLKK